MTHSVLEQPAMHFRKHAIAIVEDDDFLRRALERILRARGYATLGFDSAETFLNGGQGIGVDCVILDVSLPGMSGLELYSRLAQDADMPAVIFITGFATPYLHTAAKSLGAVDFLAKPFDAVILLSAIERASAVRRNRSPGRATD